MNLKELSLQAIDKLLESWSTDTARSVAESREESAAVVEAVIASQLEIASRVENEVCARIVEGFDAFNEQLPAIAKRIRGRYAQLGLSQTDDLPSRVLAMCKHRGWSLHWAARGVYLHLETSELIEAMRGKRGDVLGEAADVLLCSDVHHGKSRYTVARRYRTSIANVFFVWIGLIIFFLITVGISHCGGFPI